MSDDFNNSRGRKKSNFPASTTIPSGSTFDFVSGNTNFKITIENLIGDLGVTGSIEQAGAVTGVPVLDVDGSVNKIRNLENGGGINIAVSPENGITLTSTAGGIFDSITEEGQVPSLSSDLLNYEYSGATKDPTTGEWTFDEKINVPAGSVAIGTTLEISEGGQDLIIADLINAQMSFSVNSEFEDATGSAKPDYSNFGLPEQLLAQPIFNTVITDNPLSFSFASTVAAPNLRLTDRVTLKANGPVSNFRAKITDQTSGVVIRYIPNRAAYDGVTQGFDLVTGDNTFFLASEGTNGGGNFYLGYVPFVTSPGQIIDIELIADSMDMLGEPGGTPYFVAEIHDGPATELADIFNTSNIEDKYVRLNNQYVAVSAVTGGLVVNYLPTVTNDAVTSAQFTAGVASTSNPTVITDGSATFAQNDIIQLSNTRLQDGIYEVEDHTGTTLTIRGVGTVATVEDFTRDDFATAIDNAVITKINVSVFRSGIDGVWEQGFGAVTPLSFSNAVGNVIGPGSSIDNSLAYWIGTGGTNLGSSTITFTIEGSKDGRLDIEPILNTGKSILTLSNKGGGTGLQVEHDDATDVSSIIGEIGTLTVSTTADDLILTSFADLNLNAPSGSFNLSIAGDTDSLSFESSSDIRNLIMRSPELTGTVIYSLEDSTGTEKLRVFYDENADVSGIGTTDGELDISSAGSIDVLSVTDILLRTADAASSTKIFGSALPDTAAVLTLETGSTNGGTIDLHVGSRDPEGLITADGGALYLRDGGTSSDLYLKRSDASNTDWVDLLHSGSGIQGPSSVTDNALLTWDGTTGNLVQEVATTSLELSGVTTTFAFNPTLSELASTFRINDSNGASGIKIRRATDTGNSFIDNDIGGLLIRQLSGSALNISNDQAGITIASASGSNTTINSKVLIGNDGTTTDVRVRVPDTAGNALICLENSSNADRLVFEYDEAADTNTITSTNTPLEISGTESVTVSTTGGTLQLESRGTGGSAGIVSVEADETLILESVDNKIQMQAGAAAGEEILSISNTAATRISRIFVENDDPNGVITGNGGDVVIRDDDSSSRIYLNKTAAGGTAWEAVSTLPADIIQISSATELVGLATSSVITISANTTFVFTASVTTLVRFEIENNSTLTIISSSNTSYNFAGTGTLFSGNGAVGINGITFVALAGGTWWDLTTNNDKEIILQNMLVGGFKLGAITKDTDNSRGPALTMENVRFFGWNTTMVLTDLILVAADNFTAFQPNEVPRNIPCINIKTTVPWTAPQFSFQRVQGSLIGTETLLEIDSGISMDTRVNVSASPILGDSLFETASTATGVIESVADASKSAEAITSVIDTSGEARFVIAASGATIEVGQWVVHSGFTTNTAYNGDFIVTQTTGHTYHVSPYGPGGDPLAFGSNETGVLDTDSVEITDTAHGLVEGDSLNIQTDDSGDYDGGYQVLSGETTDTFRINAVWTVTHTGTWSNGGLDQTDPHVLANNNPSFADSKYLSFGHIEENGEDTNANSDVYGNINILGSTGAITVFATNGAGGTTVTSTGHGLLENQNVEITGTTSYNGIFTVFNVVIDDFDIAVAFVADDATGDWASQFHCEAERFKCTNAQRAVMTYTGNEPFSGAAKITLVANKSGSTEAYHFSVGINGIIPEQGASYMKRDIAAAASVTTFTTPVQLVKGDTVQPIQLGVGTGNNFLISNLQFEIS